MSSYPEKMGDIVSVSEYVLKIYEIVKHGEIFFLIA